MNANDGSGNVVERDEWKTSSWLFDILMEQYDFKLDCCATKDNSKVIDFPEDFLDLKEIDKTSWMNPPFSKAHVMFEHFFKIVKRGVAIYRCDNFETWIWQKIIFPKADWIFIFDKRICYDGLEGKGSRFPSALIGFNIAEPKYLNGVILKVKGDDKFVFT